MDDPKPVLAYRSAEVYEPAGDWVVAPGLLRVTLHSRERRWAVAGAAVRLVAILGLTAAVASAFVFGADTADARLCPIGGTAVLAALVARAIGTLVRAVREGRGPSVTIEAGVLTLADPARTGRRVRMSTTDVAEITTLPLLVRASAAGVVRVRIERTDGQLVTYDLRTGDARCGWRLEAELRRAAQLTSG